VAVAALVAVMLVMGMWFLSRFGIRSPITGVVAVPSNDTKEHHHHRGQQEHLPKLLQISRVSSVIRIKRL
jgi:hypothetical protein